MDGKVGQQLNDVAIVIVMNFQVALLRIMVVFQKMCLAVLLYRWVGSGIIASSCSGEWGVAL